MRSFKNLVLTTAFLIFSLIGSVFAVTPDQLGWGLPFNGVDTLQAIQAGQIKKSIRTYDRSINNTDDRNRSQYDVGVYAPIFNSNEEEDARGPREQIDSKDHGAILFTSVVVKQYLPAGQANTRPNIPVLSAEETLEVEKYYNTPNDEGVTMIERCDGFFTVLEFAWESID